MKFSQNGLSKLGEWETFEEKSYRDSKGVWTIGYGTIIYPDGRFVTQNQTITKDQALKYLLLDVQKREISVNKLITSVLTQNQYDAVICLNYNIGMHGFATSSVLKTINLNPNDHDHIIHNWMKWDEANGKILDGLVNRRYKELSELYFKDVLTLDEIKNIRVLMAK